MRRRPLYAAAGVSWTSEPDPRKPWRPADAEKFRFGTLINYYGGNWSAFEPAYTTWNAFRPLYQNTRQDGT